MPLKNRAPSPYLYDDSIVMETNGSLENDRANVAVGPATSILSKANFSTVTLVLGALYKGTTPTFGYLRDV